MFYIHQTTCISPQQTFIHPDIEQVHAPVKQKFTVLEPPYGDIPPGVLRRMSKSVRIGMGAALPLLKQFPPPDGIIIGTANAGFEDCFHFLKQIVEYNEGLLSPGSFVQSTPNALAAQLGMINHNKGYNITHVHLGLAFENAVTDVAMLLQENPGNSYLLGAVDDISSHHYALNLLAGWFKKELPRAVTLYDSDTPGSIAGEGAAMFWVNAEPANAIAQVKANSTLHSEDTGMLTAHLHKFLQNQLGAGDQIDLFLSGEDGDNRLLKYYACCETFLGSEVPVIRFKHMSGEYPTAAAMALWLACYILQKNSIPQHMMKTALPDKEHRHILIYNNHKGRQHSFILVKAPLSSGA